jgi:DNA-binding beta-propeller fold protein YncE
MRFIVISVLAGCSAAPGGDGSNGGGSRSDAGIGHCLSSNECPTGQICNEFGVCEQPPPMTDAGTPPETEYEFGPPISSARFVYVAITSQNELARIDGQTLAVTATPVGSQPKEVATIPGSDGAVVLDRTNGTATIVRPDGGIDYARVMPTVPNLNRLDIDPSGRFAVLWFDLNKQIQEGGIGNIGSLQDVTVLALTPYQEKAVDLTVGFRPRSVQFDRAGGRAYVVTQDGVSVIDLDAATSSGPTIVPPIAVADPSIPPDDLEVDIVATGDYAAVRQLDAAALRIVGLAGADAGTAFTIPLASSPSDVDLAPDGHRVYVVERDAKKLAIVDVPTKTLTANIDLADATLGSLVVCQDGTRALLFTNATLDERITMIELDQPGFPHVTWPLQKSVRAVSISPTGDTAIVLQTKIPGDPATATSFDDFIDKSYGYSMLDLATGFAKLEITPVDPSSFAYTPDGAKVYIALDGGDADTATRAFQIVHTKTGVITTKPLGSPPSAIGILPGAGQAFVSQRHPLGRVSFSAVTDDAVRTVTGFDLNSHVVD